MTFNFVRSNRSYRLLLSGSATTNLGDGVVAVEMGRASCLRADSILQSIALDA